MLPSQSRPRLGGRQRCPRSADRPRRRIGTRDRPAPPLARRVRRPHGRSAQSRQSRFRRPVDLRDPLSILMGIAEPSPWRSAPMSARIPLAAHAALTLAAAGLSAQAVHEHGGHAEALGRVTFPTSCRAQAQRRFERGVALLHSFWYERASEAFQDVVAADSTCAMGYWGQAMCLFHPLWTPPSSDELRAGLGAAVRGYAVARTPRERAYLAAVRAYYEAYLILDPHARLVADAHAIEPGERHAPRDRETSIFYALSLIAPGQANPTDTTFTYQKRGPPCPHPPVPRQPPHPGLAAHP